MTSRTWRWPIILAALTVSGLLIALIGQNEVWSAIAWCALIVPLAIGLSAFARRRS